MQLPSYVGLSMCKSKPYLELLLITVLVRFSRFSFPMIQIVYTFAENLNPMKPTHIEHIGIAVKSLEESIPYYENVLGLKCYAVEEVKDQRVKTAFFLVGQTKIELLESTDPEGPIGKFLEKKGEGIHHIAFAVENLPEMLDHAAANGVQLIDKQPRRGAEGLDIAFMHPKSTFGVLTEFCTHPEK
jgi:methylmalonyl-CoA/ethylmalonyl-CoA epimerase